MTSTPYMGLSTYDTASGSAIKFLEFRLGVAGLSSNMSKIDNFASDVSGSVGTLKSNTIYRVSATWVLTNYYEAVVTGLISYSINSQYLVTFDTTNSGSVTVNFNTLGNVIIKKINASGTKVNLASGDLKVNRYYTLVYDNTDFILTAATSMDQISMTGTANNIVKISGSSTIEDSGVPIESGVVAGTYNKVTVDKYGRATSGSNVSLTLNIVSKTADYTLTSLDDVVLVTCSGSDITVALPAAASNTGKLFNIKKLDSTIYSLIINPNLSETIDGETTISILDQYNSLQIISNGTSWFIL
jgi:hypothetical protein